VEFKETLLKRPGKQVDIRTWILSNRNQKRYRFGLVRLGRTRKGKREKGKRKLKTRRDFGSFYAMPSVSM
jgi:hypothetical protein